MVFRLKHKHFLVVCLILLDTFLVLDIVKSQTTNTVLGTTQVFQKKTISLPTFTPTPTNKKAVSPRPKAANKTVDLLQQINNFRAGKGLSALIANPETCFFANLRSQEIINSFSHDGFRSRIDDKSLPYPSYSSVAENIAMNSDPNAIVLGWINSPGHNENMSKDVPFGCVVGNGDYYVFEAWKP